MGNKHVISDLYQMQSLPLNAKVRMTQRRINEWVDEYGEDGVYISFSGGKDSTVLLDIARKLYPNIKAMFVDTGLEYPEIRQFVKQFNNVDWIKPKMTFRQVIERYGYPFISKEVSECVYGARKFLRGGGYNQFYRKLTGSGEYAKAVQGGGRPAVIISNDIGNNAAPILEVVYLTTQEKKPLPTHVKINSSKYPSTVLCEQIDTVNKDKVGDYIGQCSMAEMKKIDAALAVSIGIGINIKSNDLVKKWAEAANEIVEPEKKEPEPVVAKVEMPDIETQLEIAKITAERDVYKRLYEETMARR